jgi:hypothetical protein
MIAQAIEIEFALACGMFGSVLLYALPARETDTAVRKSYVRRTERYRCIH